MWQLPACVRRARRALQWRLPRPSMDNSSPIRFANNSRAGYFRIAELRSSLQTAPRDPEPMELEVLRSRAGLVVQAVTSGSSAPVISDYWCEECRPAEVPKNLRIIPPKLLVWLEGPLESLDPVFFRLPPASRVLAEEVRQRAYATVQSRFDRRAIPLKLRLNSSDVSAAIDDLSATIQSMCD